MSKMYIDLSTLQKPGEERSALIDVIAESLNTAAAEDISKIKVVLMAFRVFPDGREDRGKQAAPLSNINAETADAEQVVNQIINRFERAVGQGFKGRMLVAVEDMSRRGEPLAGVWERYVAGEGSADPNTYGGYGGDAYGGAPDPEPAPGQHNFQAPPPQHHLMPPTPPAAPDLGGSLLGGSMMDFGGGSGGLPPNGGSYDPGAMPDQSAQENAELFRSILGSSERRIDQAHQETRFFQAQSTTFLEYMLRQNAQFMGLVNLVVHREMQRPMLPSAGGGGPRFHPLGELAGSLLTAFLGAPPAPESDTPPPTPIPPRFQALPPAQPAFFHPAGDSTDIGGDSFYSNAWQPEPEPAPAPMQQPPGMQAESGPMPGFSGERPPTTDEFRDAMRANPDAAKEAAADLVPPAFKGFLGGGK
jgi:hypothetical protein